MSFDITKHDWSDSDIRKVTINTYATSGDSLIEILTESSGYHHTSIWLKKQDATAIFKHLGDKEQAIEIAKHFGLTADDIAQPPQSKE